jgi:hypothetical protein
MGPASLFTARFAGLHQAFPGLKNSKCGGSVAVFAGLTFAMIGL